MLHENIKAVRERKGITQEELAGRLHVVRQTVSKWERGLSVPDADMLVSLSEVLATPVSVLLGETVSAPEVDDVQAIAKRLEAINLQLARRSILRRRIRLAALGVVFAATALIFILFVAMGGSYQAWDYHDPELAVAGTILHAAEWVFVRIAPFVLAGSAVGFYLVWRRGDVG